MSKVLIINADDYGSCHAANEAIERLFDHGFLTGTTLMPPCPWAQDAADRALQNPRMKVGLHLTTTAEYARYKWGPVDKALASLTDGRGWFYATARESLAVATRADMEKEINAQFDWMAGRGLVPEHIDSHMGTVYGLDGPPHLEAVYRLCAAHGLHFRQPKRAEAFIENPPPALAAMAGKAAQQAAALGIGLPDYLFTHRGSLRPEDRYEDLKSAYLAMIERCPEGVSEMFLHPCIETPELKAIHGQWQKRVWEYELMLDDGVLKFIQRQGITLSAYAQAPFFG
jgi:predicted glycoside hydrolase/deacetylase ChbG (UPF0249 family)